ncbi:MULTISPECIES: S4 domain-containing protein [unclassified Gordonia (in: high G+C Gram-positive bacteria)]|uniref:S4 domain-containing protein n=1 Tax=Gordonia TaxID=2053 RepID=UPI000990BDD3|nr:MULTISPECIES: S4 domain-containing protein [unclassified Gordonia (in: high G+C Gram-positive bacteria)]MBR7192570.1 hypothetical protein [Gordonia sp. SCSIO 19800]MCX2755048.1 S4 domain-containing protein [Gordonia sp. 4N]
MDELSPVPHSLVERGLARSVAEASALVMEGLVSCNGLPVLRPHRMVGVADEVSVDRTRVDG